MRLLFLMIPMSLMLGFVFLFGFFKAVDSNQFEDLEREKFRILEDLEDK